MQNKGDRHTLAGALSIVSGALGIIRGILIVVFMVFFLKIFSNPSLMPGAQQLPEEFFILMVAVYSVMGLIMVLIGILGIIGGIYSLKRKNWGIALAGSIAGSISFYPCGIAAVIFVCLGKSEFDAGKTLPEIKVIV
jgi:hypothetical protein